MNVHVDHKQWVSELKEAQNKVRELARLLKEHNKEREDDLFSLYLDQRSNSETKLAWQDWRAKMGF